MIEIRTVTILPFLLMLTVLLTACYEAGNIGKIAFVRSNLSEKAVEKYGPDVIDSYRVPESLLKYTWHYDHIEVTNLYFQDDPVAIYRVVLKPSCRILSVYYVDKAENITGESSVEYGVQNKIIARFKNKVLKRIWIDAKQNGMPDSALYIFPEYNYYTYKWL